MMFSVGDQVIAVDFSGTSGTLLQKDVVYTVTETTGLDDSVDFVCLYGINRPPSTSPNANTVSNTRESFFANRFVLFSDADIQLHE